MNDRPFSKFVFCLLTLLGIAQISLAQNKYTLSGYLLDNKNGETVFGGDVDVSGPVKSSAQTDENGFFTLTLTEGTYEVVFSSIGYQPQSQQVVLNKNTRLSIKLKSSDSEELEGTTVSATADNKKITEARMGVEKLSIAEINKLPVLFGERDIVKAVTLLPGIKTGGEGNGAFFVRGGGADQNLVLLDEVLIYNPTHLLGFFSTFNSDALKNVTLYKGNMPAEFGGRLSSVMDVQMRDGNNQEFGVSGGIGVIASRLSVEGPIVKDKGSFLISGRRTYADLFLKLTGDSSLNKTILNFWDFNAKANYRINDKHRLFFSGYIGQDRLGLANSFGLDWGNKALGLRWNWIVSPKIVANTILSYNDYAYNVNVNLNTFNSTIQSRIKDWNLKEEFTFVPNNKHTVKFGLQSVLHNILPGSYSGDINIANLPTNRSWENAVYINDNWKVAPKFTIDYGLRFSAFSTLGGEQLFYELDRDRNITSATQYDKNKIVNTYTNLEPRLSANYIINPSLSLKAAYARNSQYLHLLSNSSAGNPTDKWISSNNIIKPSFGDQVSLGIAKNLNDNMYELSFETYYKHMSNQIDYIDGANIISNEPSETQLLFGMGRAYGAEFLIRKNKGKFTGWLGYTLSRTERQIDGINNGEWYVAKQDRTHDISLVGVYELSKKWTISGTFVYYTGNAVTFPSGKYNINNQTVFLYTERNAYRMPAYHRMDLSATWKFKKRGRWESDLNFSLYNVYGRQNAYAILFEDDPDNPNVTRAVQTSLFRWVPSITYNFKF